MLARGGMHLWECDTIGAQSFGVNESWSRCREASASWHADQHHIHLESKLCCIQSANTGQAAHVCLQISVAITGLEAALLPILHRL